MTLEQVRQVAIVHGVICWIAALALLATALRLLLRRPGAPWLVAQGALATALATAAFASGVLLDLPYRAHLRQRLFLASRALGWLFERKLHLAFGAFLFALCACAALLAASRAERSPEAISLSLTRAARVAYAAAALFALVACVASSLVAARMRF